MARSLIEGTDLINSVIGEKSKFRRTIRTLAGDLTLVDGADPLLFIDPGGVVRNILLPPVTKGAFHVIVHTGGAFNITVKDSTNTITVGTISTLEIGFMFCDGVKWWFVSGVA